LKNNRNVCYMTVHLFFRLLNQSCFHSSGGSSSFDSISYFPNPASPWVIPKALFFHANISIYIIDSQVVRGSICGLSLVSTFPDLLNCCSTPAPVTGTAKTSRTINTRREYSVPENVFYTDVNRRLSPLWHLQDISLVHTLIIVGSEVALSRCWVSKSCSLVLSIQDG